MAKIRPKTLSHRRKSKIHGNQVEPAEPNGALWDRLCGVRKPSMGARRQKKFGKRPNTTPRYDVRRTFRAGPVQHGSRRKPAEAGGSFCGSPGWLCLGLETSDSSKGGWRRVVGGGLGAPLDTTTRVTLQGHAWVTPRSISAARSRRRRRGDGVGVGATPSSRASCPKKTSRGCPAPNRRFRENSLEKTRKTP